MIEFYLNKNEQITGAMPILTHGTKYENLNKVIAEIEKLIEKGRMELGYF
jgi:tyrosine-protein phosphatase YwqE